MRQGWIVAAAACIAAVALGGCEPMRGTTTQSVSFKTEPAGATIDVKGAGKCATPCALTMSRGETHVAEVSRQGCYATRLIVYPTADYGRMLILPAAFFGYGYDLNPNPATLKLICGK